MNVERLAGEVVALAVAAGVRIGVAESLTGGLLSATLVSVPGASQVFTGGVVAYDTELKRSLLGVDGALLAAHGPVHPEVAKQMAIGVRRACRIGAGLADIGLATTGVAGPDPDPQTGKPPGEVWIGVSDVSGSVAYLAQIDAGGSRAEIRAAAVREALFNVHELLLQRTHDRNS